MVGLTPPSQKQKMNNKNFQSGRGESYGAGRRTLPIDIICVNLNEAQWGKECESACDRSVNKNPLAGLHLVVDSKATTTDGRAYERQRTSRCSFAEIL